MEIVNRDANALFNSGQLAIQNAEVGKEGDREVMAHIVQYNMAIPPACRCLMCTIIILTKAFYLHLPRFLMARSDFHGGHQTKTHERRRKNGNETWIQKRNIIYEKEKIICQIIRLVGRKCLVQGKIMEFALLDKFLRTREPENN